MSDYRPGYRHGQSALGYTYADQPVASSSGIQRFEGMARPDHCMGTEFHGFGCEIIDSAAWLSDGHRARGRELVMRQPPGTSDSGLMSPTVEAAIFGAGCLGVLPGVRNVFVIHGDSPGYYLDEMLDLGYVLLWDGRDRHRKAVLGHSDVFYGLASDGRLGEAVYMGDVPDEVLCALRARLDADLAEVLHDSLFPLVRLLERGRTGMWQAIGSIPMLDVVDMSFGFIEQPESRPVAGVAADDPVAAYALEHANPELVAASPITGRSLARFQTASAFARIWEGMVRNADERGRAEHLHDLLAARLAQDGIPDKVGRAWLLRAIDVVGHALGVDYAFEAYLSGVEVEHIVEFE